MNALYKSFRISPMDFIALAIVVIVVGPIVFLVMDRDLPVKVLRYEAFPPKVKPGETVYRVIKVERLRVCETDPDTVIIDGARVRWNFEEPALLAPGKIGIDDYKRPVVIPLQANPGPAEMRTSTTWICNPIHKIWPIRSANEPLKFEILPP